MPRVRFTPRQRLACSNWIWALYIALSSSRRTSSSIAARRRASAAVSSVVPSRSITSRSYLWEVTTRRVRGDTVQRLGRLDAPGSDLRGAGFVGVAASRPGGRALDLADDGDQL